MRLAVGAESDRREAESEGSAATGLIHAEFPSFADLTLNGPSHPAQGDDNDGSSNNKPNRPVFTFPSGGCGLASGSGMASGTMESWLEPKRSSHETRF